MKFKYQARAERADRLEPAIEVELRFGGKCRRVLALVDSGASESMMPREIAEFLGIDVESGAPGTSEGTGGERPIWYHNEIEIVHKDFALRTWFGVGNEMS